MPSGQRSVLQKRILGFECFYLAIRFEAMELRDAAAVSVPSALQARRFAILNPYQERAAECTAR